MLGVWAFMLVCWVTSFVSILLAVVEAPSVWHSTIDVCAMFPAVCQLQSIFTGACLVASLIAISNIYYFQDSLRPFLEPATDRPSGAGFSSWWKCVSLVMLVFMSFLQQFIIALVVWDWSPEQQRLLYSTCVIYEALVLSLVHLRVWSAHQEWYNAPWLPANWLEQQGLLRSELDKHEALMAEIEQLREQCR
eukprot:CAMPEP_0204377820 /NCGR_PEP_ID=MMETSP0469-20131031/51251_1 /ASSEMBLY_ACC=CAM_ASM_000384 /TAXON_ID=2969 /ORGANISM="Oxyrrhis marina" /LENGTH=191 /DNA_ID=CAMNT_0051368991 /DNA_START=21 /DNA_END=592 /DNA_ORIENTATION=+